MGGDGRGWAGIGGDVCVRKGGERRRRIELVCGSMDGLVGRWRWRGVDMGLLVWKGADGDG